MRRQGLEPGQYGYGGIKSMVASQLRAAQQRDQQRNDNSYPGRDLGQTAGEHQYTAPKVRQSGWDRDRPNIPNQISSYAYNEGVEGAQSIYDAQKSDLKGGLEKRPRKESSDQAPAGRIEARYEDYNLSHTFEGLEQNFREDIAMLSKELHDAEDAENTRHRERLNEINAKYHEKLLALRARQTTYREEFLRKESLERQQQYQQASMRNYANNVAPREPHGYPLSAEATPPDAAASREAYLEAHRSYASDQYRSLEEQPEYPEFRGGGQGPGRGQGDGFEQRGQYPGGRAYNSGGRRF